MRHDQVQPVFARLRKDVRKRISGEVLELVDIEIKIIAFFFRNAHAFHRRKLDFGDEHGTQKRGVVLANPAFGHVNQENFARVHRLLHVERAFRLAHDVAHHRRVQELADFVLNRHNHFVAHAIRIIFEFVGPELLHHRVFDVVHDLGAIFSVDQEPVDAEKRRAGRVKQGHDAVLHNAFHARGPNARPDLGEDTH